MGSKEAERQDEQRTLVSYTEDQPLAGTGRAKPGEQQGHGSELHNGPCFVEEQEGLLLLPDQNITYPTSTLASFLGHRKKTILGGPVCTSPPQVETKVLPCRARDPLSLISQLSTGSLSLWSPYPSTSLSLNCS